MRRERSLRMSTIALEDIQVGWKVFIGADEVGRVTESDHAELVVKRGNLIKKTIRVPRDEIVEAADGVVDLRLDAATKARFDIE